jgi:hypothetical protein
MGHDLSCQAGIFAPTSGRFWSLTNPSGDICPLLNEISSRERFLRDHGVSGETLIQDRYRCDAQVFFNPQFNSYLRHMSEYGDVDRCGDVFFVADEGFEKIKPKDNAYADSQSAENSGQQDLLFHGFCGGSR